MTEKIRFDNHIFEKRNFEIYTLHYLYIAKKARNGDSDAIEFLYTFDVRITDYNGNSYWPKGDQ